MARSGGWCLWGNVHIPHPVRDSLHGGWVQRSGFLPRGFSRAFVAPGMPTGLTRRLEIFEHGLARVALPSDPHQDVFEFASRQWERRFRVARVPVTVF